MRRPSPSSVTERKRTDALVKVLAASLATGLVLNTTKTTKTTNTANSATLKMTHALFDTVEKEYLGHFRVRKRVYANRPDISDNDILKYHHTYIVPVVEVKLGQWHNSVSHRPLHPAALKQIADARAHRFIGRVRSIRQ